MVEGKEGLRSNGEGREREEVGSNGKGRGKEGFEVTKGGGGNIG